MLTTYNGILVEEANRIAGDIYDRTLHINPWIDLVDTDDFPTGMGDIISGMIWERTLPSTTVTWKNMMAADGNGGADTILPPVQSVSTAKTLRDYRLQHTALESDLLNINDLRTAVIGADQLESMRDNLAMNTGYLWSIRARTEYHNLVKRVNLLSTGNTENASADPTAESDMVLSNGALARYRQRMIRQGANKRPLDRMNGAPIFGLICDSEVSDQLRSETQIADALKYDGRANELLAPLGVEKSYKNFFHIIDDVSPRFTFADDALTEVLPYTIQAADPSSGEFGDRQVENTDYETAPITVSYIFHQDVMKLLYPTASVVGAAGVSFNSVNYRGEWTWCNEKNFNKSGAAYNPDGTIGFFRGVFASATKPMVKEFGTAIFHRRPGF